MQLKFSICYKLFRKKHTITILLEKMGFSFSFADKLWERDMLIFFTKKAKIIN